MRSWHSKRSPASGCMGTWRIGLRGSADLWTFAAVTVVVGIVYSLLLVTLNRWMARLRG